MTDSSEKGIIVEESAKEVITVKKTITFLLTISVFFVMAACSQSQKEQPQSVTEKENTTVETTAQPTTAQPTANGETSASEFDFDSKTVKLNSGYEMPILGLGTWTLSNEEAENSVYHALKDGYRLIDTARYYQCETGVGKGIKKAVEEGIVKREDVFVTSKIMPGDYERAAQGINDSLRDLGLEYIDLMLIHQPGSNDEAVYKAMEQAVRDGMVRSIGISNYYTPEAFDEVMSYAQIPPAVIQNENHIYYQNTVNTVLWWSRGIRSAAEVIRQRILTMKRLRRLQKVTEKLRLRSYCAGICRQAISPFPVHPIPTISPRITVFLTLN